MTDSDVYLPSASSTESFVTSYSSSKEEMEVGRPTKENRVHQTKVSTKTVKDGFSRAVFRSRLEQKAPITECLICCLCVLFSMAKSMLRMV